MLRGLCAWCVRPCVWSGVNARDICALGYGEGGYGILSVSFLTRFFNITLSHSRSGNDNRVANRVDPYTGDENR